MVLFKLISLCLIGYCLGLISGYQVLPEFLTEINTTTNNAACYGTITHFEATCQSGTVIGVQAVKVGAKQNSLKCPAEVVNNTTNNDICCLPDQMNDCISVYSYVNSRIDYRFHKNCSGYQICKEPIPVVRATTSCRNDTKYMNYTNYMFMEYACIEKSRIGNLCDNMPYIVSSGTFYLQSPSYPNPINYGISTCTCHVQAVSNLTDINFYTLDIRLGKDTGVCGQSLTVTDTDGYNTNIDTWDCSTATIFNITKQIKRGNVRITFTNTLRFDDGYIWIGVQANDSGALEISCNVNYSIPPTTTSATANSGTKAPSIETTTVTVSPPGSRLPVFIGIAVGALLFLILVIIILVCCTKKKKKRKIAPNEQEFSSDLNSPMPTNTAFSRTQDPFKSLES